MEYEIGKDGLQIVLLSESIGHQTDWVFGTGGHWAGLTGLAAGEVIEGDAFADVGSAHNGRHQPRFTAQLGHQFLPQEFVQFLAVEIVWTEEFRLLLQLLEPIIDASSRVGDLMEGCLKFVVCRHEISKRTLLHGGSCSLQTVNAWRQNRK